MNITRLIQTLRSARNTHRTGATDSRPIGPRQTPWTPMERMEGRTMMSAVVFVGGWGASMYAVADDSAPAIQTSLVAKQQTLRESSPYGVR